MSNPLFKAGTTRNPITITIPRIVLRTRCVATTPRWRGLNLVRWAVEPPNALLWRLITGMFGTMLSSMSATMLQRATTKVRSLSRREMLVHNVPGSLILAPNVITGFALPATLVMTTDALVLTPAHATDTEDSTQTNAAAFVILVSMETNAKILALVRTQLGTRVPVHSGRTYVY